MKAFILFRVYHKCMKEIYAKTKKRVCHKFMTHLLFFVFVFYSNSVLKPEFGMVGESMMNDAAEWVERNGPL